MGTYAEEFRPVWAPDVPEDTRVRLGEDDSGARLQAILGGLIVAVVSWALHVVLPDED